MKLFLGITKGEFYQNRAGIESYGGIYLINLRLRAHRLHCYKVDYQP
jgi:hypothetical protein